MEITTTNKDARTAEVRVAGEMNIYHALDGKARLMAAIEGAETVELDLSDVTEFDSSGLQLLLLAWREKEKAGSGLTLTAKSPAVDNVIGLFNLSELFERKAAGEA